MGSTHQDYKLNLGIFLSKEIKNHLGGGNIQLTSFVPSNLRQPYPGSINPTSGQAFQYNAPFQGGILNQPTNFGYLAQKPPPLNLIGPSNYLQTAYGPTGIPTRLPPQNY